MKRIEMRSPASSGIAMVPEGQVDRFIALGWRRAEVSPKPTPKATPKRAPKADDGDE